MDGATVLVVNDDRDIVQLLEVALELEGYTVLSAVGAEALRLAHERQPDVILLDLMMPVMDGVEVSRRLRADPSTALIPVIVMSAHERLDTTGNLIPAQDQLPKPFGLNDLYSTVGRWAKPA
jgi:CheY-like chemotaxis protein